MPFGWNFFDTEKQVFIPHYLACNWCVDQFHSAVCSTRFSLVFRELLDQSTAYLSVEMENYLQAEVCTLSKRNVYVIHPKPSADDQALRIWNVRGRCHLQTLQDKSERWGQVTCLKWLSTTSPEGSILCFGTGRGIVLIYQGGRDLVRAQLPH